MVLHIRHELKCYEGNIGLRELCLKGGLLGMHIMSPNVPYRLLGMHLIRIPRQSEFHVF